MGVMVVEDCFDYVIGVVNGDWGFKVSLVGVG